jgi:hypothetical protein
MTGVAGFGLVPGECRSHHRRRVHGPAAPTGGATRRTGKIRLRLPVVVDPSIPTNQGAGTNEDTVLVIRADDIWLWESVVRTRALPEVGSGTLTTRLQAYQYLALATRYPKAVSAITGTG